MSPQQYQNLNVGQQGLTFMTPAAPNQLTLSTNYFGGERKSLPEMGYNNKNHYNQIENENEEEEEEESKFGNVKLCARGHWRPHEDAKLRELVALHGPQNWNLIAEKLDGRSGKSCRLRWFNQLDPRINKRSFNEEEEDRLLAAHRMYGNKWALIARLFPGRTDNSVKNHWHVIMARRHREQNSIYRRRKPSPSSLSTSPHTYMPRQHHHVVCSVNVDAESGSTCTELSLSPSSPGLGSFSLSRFGQIGSFTQKDLTTTNVGFDQLNYTKRSYGPKAVDQCGNSDSNSDITASDSVVAKNMTNLQMGFENESGVCEGNNNRPFFIDFLGVGHTY